MTESSASRRADASARRRILRDLKDGHRQLEVAYRDFRRQPAGNETRPSDDCLQQVLQQLQQQAAIEREFLYPAARKVLADSAGIDVAEIEHEVAAGLIERLRTDPGDRRAARFTVLCECALHNAKERGALLRELARQPLDWTALAARIDERRAAWQHTLDEPAFDADDDSERTAARLARRQSNEDLAPTTGTKTLPAGPNHPAASAAGGRRI